MTIILRRVSSLLLISVILLEFVILAKMLDFFQIKYITTPHFFSPLLYEQGGKNLLRFDAVALAKALEQENPKIRNVVVQKKLPSTLVVRFESREPVLVAADRDQQTHFLVDKTGVVFEITKKTNQYPLLITRRVSLKEGVILADPGEKTAITMVKLIEETNLELERVTIEAEKMLAVIDSIEIVLRTTEVDPNKLKALQFLVKRFTIEGKKPKKIDLRFEKPIVKF